MSSLNKGIDFRQAYEILASRHVQQKESEHERENHHHSGLCHHVAPATGETMGQVIDLTSLGEEGENEKESVEETHKKLQEERAHRKIQLQEKLSSMSILELLNSLFEAQQQRVVTYREYEKGLVTVLHTGNMTYYPAVCAHATASFSVLSDTVREIQGVLEVVHDRKDLSVHISELQKQEQEKLSLTAALHLERIRENSYQVEGSDEGIAALVREGVTSLRQRIALTVDSINDVLDELRYALSELR